MDADSLFSSILEINGNLSSHINIWFQENSYENIICKTNTSAVMQVKQYSACTFLEVPNILFCVKLSSEEVPMC